MFNESKQSFDAIVVIKPFNVRRALQDICDIQNTEDDHFILLLCLMLSEMNNGTKVYDYMCRIKVCTLF